MDKFEQMRAAERIGKLMRAERLSRIMTLRREAKRRDITATHLSQMEQGKVPPILAEGTRVEIGGISPGVGVVVKEQNGGSLVKFDDFEFPNAHFWWEVTPIVPTKS